MHRSIRLTQTTSSSRSSPVLRPNDNKATDRTRFRALKANLGLSRSILAQCLNFPLLLLSAGLARAEPCAGTPFVFEETGKLGNSRGLHAATSLVIRTFKLPSIGNFLILTYIVFFIDYTNSTGKTKILPEPILAFSFDHVTNIHVHDDSMSGNIYSIVAYDLSGPFKPATGPSFNGSGKAWYVDGTQQQRIEVGGTALTVSAFTIMADVRLNRPVNFTDPANQRWEVSEKAGSYWANIRMDQGSQVPGPPYVLRVGGFFDGHQDTQFTGERGLMPGKWQNVALVFDPVAHTLSSYIDGVLDHTTPRDGALDTSISHNGIDEKLVLGAKHRLGGAGELLQAFFDGQMDNYRLYNVALSATEVASVAGTPVIPNRVSKKH